MTRPNHKTNLGSTNPFPSVAVAGGYSVTQDVQLISARVDAPTQWVINVMPATQQGHAAVVPWYAPWDGTTDPGVSPPLGGVPQNSPLGYKLRMSWGAGGVRGQTVIDYPMAGAAFALTCDTLDLNAFNPQDSAIVVATLAEIPKFGAFMVPGTTGEGPRLTDMPQAAAAHAGETVYWSVKPYARFLWVTINGADPANAAALYRVTFGNYSGASFWNTLLGQDAGSSNNSQRPIPVPPQATYVAITPLSAVPGAGLTFNLMWEMVLA